MKYTYVQYAQALYESLQDTKPKDHDTVIENFIKVLAANGDLVEYDKIIAEFEIYDRTQRGIKEVEVTTAQDIKFNKPLLDELNHIVGKDIQLKQKVDENLVGGVVIKVDDTLIDGSIKRQLVNLEQELKD